MDRIEFKKQIDSIYEKLYSINESLSQEDSKEFIKGYQEGIQEGWKIFQEHITEENPFTFVTEALFGGVAKNIGKMVGGAKGLLQQGKQWAAKAWKTVGEFATSVINKIKGGISTAATWISEQPEKIKNYLTGIYNNVIEEMKSAAETLKDKAQELSESIKNIWNNVISGIKSAIESVKTTLAQNAEKAKAWFDKNYQLIIQTCEEWKNSSVEWMKKTGAKISEIAGKVKSGTIQATAFVVVGAAIIISVPFYLLYLGIKKIPTLYQMSQDAVEAGLRQLESYWLSLQQEYAAGWNVGMEKTGVSTGAIPVRNPQTGKMMPAGTPTTPTPATEQPTGEKRFLSFTQFLNEKKKKDDFLSKINKKKDDEDGKECETCKKKKCECEK